MPPPRSRHRSPRRLRRLAASAAAQIASEPPGPRAVRSCSSASLASANSSAMTSAARRTSGPRRPGRPSRTRRPWRRRIAPGGGCGFLPVGAAERKSRPLTLTTTWPIHPPVEHCSASRARRRPARQFARSLPHLLVFPLPVIRALVVRRAFAPRDAASSRATAALRAGQSQSSSSLIADLWTIAPATGSSAQAA